MLLKVLEPALLKLVKQKMSPKTQSAQFFSNSYWWNWTYSETGKARLHGCPSGQHRHSVIHPQQEGTGRRLEYIPTFIRLVLREQKDSTSSHTRGTAQSWVQTVKAESLGSNCSCGISYLVSWINYLISLCFCFLICKVRIITGLL